MRVTAETRERTREALLQAGRDRFAAGGLAATTVRDLARAAGVATGTLFNYFSGKEALAAAIVEDATQAARAAFLQRRRRDATCHEDLFAHIAAELRSLQPFRRFVAEVAVQTTASGTARPRLRETHVATVRQILADHDRLPALVPVAEQLYWTLYTGILTFWSHDESRGQSETLALLDEALTLFVRSLVEPRAESRGDAR